MRQCDSERRTAGATTGGGSAGEPLPGAIQDAVAAAIEDGATMDEIVARVRAHDDEGSDLIPRARRCARARPAEGRWAARMDGLICLQRETVRFAEEWVRTREPGAEGLSALIAIETLRTLALRTMAALAAREEPVAAEELGRLALALNRIERADRLRIEREQAAADPAARARRSGRTRGPHDPCRTGRNRPPGLSRGSSSLGAQARRHSGGLPALPRTLPSPRRSRRPIRLPTTGRRIYVTRAWRAIRGTRTGRGMPTSDGGRRKADSGRPTLPSAPAEWSGPG